MFVPIHISTLHKKDERMKNAKPVLLIASCLAPKSSEKRLERLLRINVFLRCYTPVSKFSAAGDPQIDLKHLLTNCEFYPKESRTVIQVVPSDDHGTYIRFVLMALWIEEKDSQTWNVSLP